MRVARLIEEAILPTVKHLHDAGMDFYSYGVHRIEAHQSKIIPTGITVEVPEGYVMLLKPKSRNDFLVGGGVVDWTYRGEILFKIFNTGNFPLYIYRADPIGQGIFVQNLEASVEEVASASIQSIKTARGVTGGIVTQYESMGDEVV